MTEGDLGTFLVECPCCGERIEVDRRTGRVTGHKPKPQVKPGGDAMKDALQRMQQDKARLDDYFSKARGSLEEKKKELEKKFEQEKKRIQDSGDTSRPINPMDLD